MELITTKSSARAGLLGNPSDGYFGKTLSFAFSNFEAEIILTESKQMNFLAANEDQDTFKDANDFIFELNLYGYYGGVRLLKAITKIFFEYCRDRDIHLENKNFTVRYCSNIPRLVGLSGSSAIVTAMLKALQQFYNVEIPLDDAPTLCLNAELQELGLQCGLQDRVIQMYGGLVFMDFNKDFVESTGHGIYQRLSPALLPNLYIAYNGKCAEMSGIYHKKLKHMFESNKENMMVAMSEFADIAQKGMESLICGRKELLHDLINQNFDLRNKIFNVSERNLQMVMTARSSGASAKFAGSGGAIVGTYEDDRQFELLKTKMEEIDCKILIPSIS